ncbi:Neutral alpha-glucosidase AB [Phlyctema vagabunda]|uniref:alpha-glucosidase n=1 Tax=Phlyctema vagabunda TaxID=108571 RepID=A0ABR4PCG4_9HELO
MLQNELVPQQYEVVEHNGFAPGHAPISTDISLLSTDTDIPFTFTFELLKPGLFRTTFTSSTHPLPPHPSAFRPRSDLGGQKITSLTKGTQRVITSGPTKAVIDWRNTPIVSIYQDGSDIPIHQDLPHRSYAADSTGIAHYTRYKRNTLHVGLGEKAAPMDLSNRSFTLSATDCFGYDVYRTDPLYKHIPLLINATPQGCVGSFSTSHSRGMYSVGAEIDGLWGHFKVYRQAYGGLEEYTLVGQNLQEVVKMYADLVGYPKLVPRWAFGYIAGGMKYSMLDEPRACDALMNFADKLQEHDIPCSAFQLSSGYTVAETEPKTRNVFTWNRHRFPEPEKFVTDYRARGIRIIANVKPYVLMNHPEYQKLLAADALFKDPRTNKAGTVRLWSAGGGESGIGSHIDFTSRFAYNWWSEGIKSLRKIGIEGIWNDNNEYTVPDDFWQCSLEDEDKLALKVGKKIGLWGRAMHAELMGRSSHDAVIDLFPNERPFILTRSATAGTMRFAASSWGGDNVTSWDGMKGATSLSLNAGMSLIQCYGHDIGGFEGPQPSPELLLRWIQLGIHSPRFAINCFKTDENDNTIGGVIEPWMYPEITPLIRSAIKRRYELIPYLYSLMLQSHITAIPTQRWTGWGYEKDPEVWTERVMNGETQYWLGSSLLVGGVYEPGETIAKMYLPTSGSEDDGFLNLSSPNQYIEAGQWVEVTSEWKDSIPLLAKVGSAIPIGKDVQSRAPGDHTKVAPHLAEDDYRAIEIFPPHGSSGEKVYSNTWYEDDGIDAKPEISNFTVAYKSTETAVEVDVSSGPLNGYVPAWKDIHIILPINDTRMIVSPDPRYKFTKSEDSRNRSVFQRCAI